MKKPKVALVYDWLNQWGGAERIICSLQEIFPQADLYTGVFAPQAAKWVRQKFRQPRTTFLNRLPAASQKHYFYFYLFPFAFESLDLSSYDLVISLTSFPGKFILTGPETFHLCYCLTPPRFLWQRRSLSGWARAAFPLLAGLRLKDALAAERPDWFFASCHNVARRIEKFYRRKAEVVYPGIDLQRFRLNPAVRKKEFFLVVSRLVEYKRVDLVVEVFNQLGWPLVIVGRGRKEKELRRIARKNICFLGKVSDSKLVTLYQQARAVICPQEEDFGLVPLEAQACGCPVIAYGYGGARETVQQGVTGEFFSLQTKESLLELLMSFRSEKYRPEKCRENAQKFSHKKFLVTFKEQSLKRWRQFCETSTYLRRDW